MKHDSDSEGETERYHEAGLLSLTMLFLGVIFDAFSREYTRQDIWWGDVIAGALDGLSFMFALGAVLFLLIAVTLAIARWRDGA